MLDRITNLLTTLFFLPPEISRSANEVNEKSEVWSLGIILCFIATGRLPPLEVAKQSIRDWLNQQAIQNAERIPEDFVQLIEQCCIDVPSRRPMLKRLVKLFEKSNNLVDPVLQEKRSIEKMPEIQREMQVSQVTIERLQREVAQSERRLNREKQETEELKNSLQIIEHKFETEKSKATNLQAKLQNITKEMDLMKRQTEEDISNHKKQLKQIEQRMKREREEFTDQIKEIESKIDNERQRQSKLRKDLQSLS